MPSVGIIETLMGLVDQGDTTQTPTNEIIALLQVDNANVGVQEDIEVETSAQDNKNVGVQSLIRQNPFTIVWVLAPSFPASDSDPNRPGLLDRSLYLS